MAADSFVVCLNEDAHAQFMDLDSSVRERIKKRLEWLRSNDSTRTLKGQGDIWVLEIGNFRALYLIDFPGRKKIVFFIGDHKDYEKEYARMF